MDRRACGLDLERTICEHVLSEDFAGSRDIYFQVSQCSGR